MSRDNLDLPWSLDLMDGINIRDCNDAALIVEYPDDVDLIDLWHQQARLIVRAVNNHDALVEMVSELRMLVRVTGPLTTARERADKLLATIEAA